MDESLEARVAGKASTRFWLEWLGNSAQFPITGILLELMLESPSAYLQKADPYAILGSSLVQAYVLSRQPTTSPAHRLLGNLIGPALYSIIEVAFEGWKFFASPHHIAYWIFALAIGLMQMIRFSRQGRLANFVLIVESLTRTSILFFMYAIFESNTHSAQTTSIAVFFNDPSHQFIGAAILLIGISLGWANLTSERYHVLLKQTAAQLKTYSEWLLGRDLLNRSIIDPSTLNLVRRERVVLFMDIRGFTAWSETQPPEVVVHLLDRYYQLTEALLAEYPIIKVKFSADEALVVFPTAFHAVEAALKLRNQINEILSGYGLGVGIGLNSGPVVEGLLGSETVKFYDVIGDTVNTAKRIESAAQKGEVLVSESVCKILGQLLELSHRREITVKGKTDPVVIYLITDIHQAA